MFKCRVDHFLFDAISLIKNFLLLCDITIEINNRLLFVEMRYRDEELLKLFS